MPSIGVAVEVAYCPPVVFLPSELFVFSPFAGRLGVGTGGFGDFGCTERASSTVVVVSVWSGGGTGVASGSAVGTIKLVWVCDGWE